MISKTPEKSFTKIMLSNVWSDLGGYIPGIPSVIPTHPDTPERNSVLYSDRRKILTNYFVDFFDSFFSSFLGSSLFLAEEDLRIPPLTLAPYFSTKNSVVRVLLRKVRFMGKLVLTMGRKSITEQLPVCRLHKNFSLSF